MNLKLLRAVLACLVLLVSLCPAAHAQSSISAVPGQIDVATVQGHSDYRVEIHLDSLTPGVAWTAEADQPWIGVDPVSGVTPATLTVKLDASQLTAGTHTGTINLTAAGQNAVTVPVKLLVEPLAIVALKSSRTSASVYGLSYRSKFSGGSGQSYLIEFDSAAGTIWRVVEVGLDALDFAIHERDERIYVSYQSSPLQALDTSTLQKVQSYPFIAVKPGAGAKGQLYMTSGSERLRLLDTVTGEVLATHFIMLPTGEPSPSGAIYYIDSTHNSHEICRYDYANGGFLEGVVTPRQNWDRYDVIVVSDDGRRIFWNGECFDSNLSSQWVIGEPIFAASAGGHLAFGNANTYDVDARRQILGMPKNVTAVAYNITSETLVAVTDSKVKFFKFDGPIALPPPVLSAGLVGGYSAQLNWTDESLETGFTLQQRLKGAVEWQDVSSLIPANTASFAVEGLQPQQEYEFRIKAKAPDLTSEWSNVLAVLTAPPVVPGATTLEATDVTYYGALVHGTINPNGFSTVAYFEWGATTDYGHSTLGRRNIAADASEVKMADSLWPVEAGATYHYRMVATSSEGTTYGTDHVVTLPPAIPMQSSQTYRDVTYSTAIVFGSVNPRGGDTVAHYEYGTTRELAERTPDILISAANSEVKVEQLITDLLPDTIYYFRLVTVNAAGAAVPMENRFKTLPLPPVSPAITSVSSRAVTDSAVVLAGSVNPSRGETLVHFEYGTTEALGQSTTSVSVGSGDVPVAFEQSIDALLANTTYHFKMVAVNVAGTTTVSGGTFRTLPVGPLTAVDDVAFTTAGETRLIDVLANDSGVLRTAMQVASIGKTTAGSVTVNADGTITYVPGKAFAGHDFFTYTIRDDNGRTATATVTITETTRGAAGVYDALIGTSESTYEQAGFLRLNVSATGAITGKLNLSGYALPFKARLAKNGTAVVKLPSAREERFSLSLSFDPATQRLLGTVTGSALTGAFSANRVPYSSKNPAPQTGLFTLVLPSGNGEADPAGHGFATMKVSPDGAILLRGRTRTGTAFSSSSHVDGNGTFPLYSEIRQSAPAKLYGMMQFRDVPGTSDCDGGLGMSESSSEAAREIPAIGSRYVVPASSALVLPFPSVKNNALLEFGRGETSLTSGPIHVTLAPNKITSQDRGVSALTLDRKTGLFSGSLVVAGKSSPFYGVIFQRQAMGMGVVKAATGAGWVELSNSASANASLTTE